MDYSGSNRCYNCDHVINWHYRPNTYTPGSNSEFSRFVGPTSDIEALSFTLISETDTEVVCLCSKCRLQNKFIVSYK